MFQLDEKVISDSRTLITINKNKSAIDTFTKNGTIHYEMEKDTLWLTTPKIRQAYINKDPNLFDHYDKIILARNGVDIDGAFSFDDNTQFKKDVEIKEDLLVRGNLKVEGSSSIIDTPKLTIEDNMIELNRNETASGITLSVSGTALNRGTKPFARYIFSETDKAFVLDTATEMEDGVGSTWILKAYAEAGSNNIAGQVDIAKKVFSPTAVFNNLTVNNNSNLNTLVVGGTSSFTGAAEFLSSVLVNGTITGKSNVLFEKNLEVQGTSLFKKSVTMNNSLTVDDMSTFKKLSTFKLGAKIETVGLDILADGARITGETNLTGTLNVSELASFAKNVNVADTTTTNYIVASTKGTIKDLQVTNNLKVDKNSTLAGTLTVAGNTTLNGSNLTINSLTTINENTTVAGSNLSVTTDSSGANGDLLVEGNATINKTLAVNSTSTFANDVNVTANLIANNLTARSNITVQNGNGNGYKFWASDNYKIYMSETAYADGGSIAGASASDYNMYFKMMNGSNRGFVFKNATDVLAQIEGNGKFRTANHMYAKGSQVLRHADMGHQPTNNTAINACMVDGKHASDLLLRDGTQAMTGNLYMNLNKIYFNNDDYMQFDDTAVSLNGNSYGGTFSLFADNALLKSVLSLGAVKTGDTYLKDLMLHGADTIEDTSGRWMMQSFGSALIIGGHLNSSTIFDRVLFKDTPEVHVDNDFTVGANNELIANGTSFTYKGNDVLTTAGHRSMVGPLNMGRQILSFNAGSNTGTAGAADSDCADIFAEHDVDTETSRFVIRISDNPDDSIILRTSNRANGAIVYKDSLNISHSKILFSDNPLCLISGVERRLLHYGDTGSGNGLDADKLDGKHYSDLASQFVDANGDTMTGRLVMNSSINMTGTNKIIFNGNNDIFLRSGSTDNTGLVLGSSNGIYFNGNSSGTNQMILGSDGNLSVRGSNVLRQADEGHNNGIDADTLDGQHASYFSPTTHVHNYSEIKNKPVGSAGQIYCLAEDGKEDLNLSYILSEGSLVENSTELAEAKQKTIDFREIFDTWYRFSHNNTTAQPANETETQAWNYDAVTNTVKCTVNSTTHIGFVSKDKYDKYVHECVCKSINADDDMIGVVIAFAKDANGIEHTLTANRIRSRKPYWTITYDYGKSTGYTVASKARLAGDDIDGETENTDPTGWHKIPNGTKIRIERNGDVIKAYCSPFNSTTIDESSLLTIDLTSDSRLAVFRGAQQYGYCCYSQNASTFNDITFSGGLGNSIYDISTNQKWTHNGTNWVKDTSSNMMKDIGPGKLIYNKETKKLYYTKSDGTAIRIDTYGSPSGESTCKFVKTIGNGSSTTITLNHGLGTADAIVNVYEVSTGEKVYPDIKVTGTQITITFATAPTTNQYKVVAMG